MQNTALVPLEQIDGTIRVIRGQKVMLDADLAQLYNVETRALNQAVKRNRDRFPRDFMFRLSPREADRVIRSRSQFVILKRGENIKHRPYAFTEQGVAMLSSVLRSHRAVQVNIEIMRAFVRLRQVFPEDSVSPKLAALQKRYDSQFKVVFDAILQLMGAPKHDRRFAGFHARHERFPGHGRD